MSEPIIENARIASTELGSKSTNGILSCWLYLEFDGSGQGFGGYVLDSPDRTKTFKRIGNSFGMEFIASILRTVGVESWEDLPGKHIRAKHDHSKVHAIGNIIRDDWFSPEELAQSMKTSRQQEG